MWAFTPNASWITITAALASPLGATSYSGIAPSAVLSSATSPRVSSAIGVFLPEVERDLDRAGTVLGGERGERVAPARELERVREHPGEVDAPVAHQLQVVLDAVAAVAVDLLEAERVRPDE